MKKEVIYFRYNNESEIEDILDDLITYTIPNRNQRFYCDLYSETVNLNDLIKYIKKSKCHFRIITSKKDISLVNNNMSKLVNAGKVKIL